MCLQSISPKSSTFSISLPSSVQKPVHAQAISQGDLHKPESEGTMNGEFSRETIFHPQFHLSVQLPKESAILFEISR